MRLLVIQHIACEPPGFLEDEMHRREVSFDRVDLSAGDDLPPWRSYHGLIVMGGPMGVADRRENPWLKSELQTITEAVLAGRAYLGVCLGAQLLAAALGAEVTTGPRPEVGVGAVQLRSEAASDPVLGGLPRRLSVLHWHQDTFTLPQDATLLASSPHYPNQAFRFREAWALQFHLEVGADLARQWLDLAAYRRSAETVLGEAADRLPNQVGDLSVQLKPLAGELMGRWLDRCDLVELT